MTLIIILLAVAAIYSAGLWLYLVFQSVRGRIAPDSTLELHTFHLGLCAILAAGFLGLILKG